MFKGLIGGYNSVIVAFLRHFPTKLGIKLRNLYWRGKLKKYGKNIMLSAGITIRGAENIEIGNDVTIMGRSYLYAQNNGQIKIGDWFSANTNVQIGAADDGNITIGNDVIIGPNAVLRASNHVYENPDVPIRQQGHTGGSIVIEDDVWIAANAVILPDVKVARGSVVAAGAVVNRDVPEFTVVGGVPAKIIGKRKS